MNIIKRNDNLIIKFNNHEYPGKIKLPQLSDIRIYNGKNVIIKIKLIIYVVNSFKKPMLFQ